MMNVAKLQGIADAIEAESKQPSPSHNNLARLTSMFMRELITWYTAPPETANAEVSPPVQTKVTDEPPPAAAPDPEPEPAKPVKKAHRKK